MVTHREIKKLEAIQNTLREIEKGNLDKTVLKETIKTIDELMELYFDAYLITGLNAKQAWGPKEWHEPELRYATRPANINYEND
jgi:hypothetical protein